ncbi:MAG TPA: EAL domain-containing protein [Actinotalea sp.]|jgi:EAL and modified HD-GYP domain-containing signal transduction protein
MSRLTSRVHRDLAPGAQRVDPVLIGRQSIFTMDGARFGYELLYRSSRPGSPVDTWSAHEQDDATRHVIRSALACGLPVLCGARPAFVNATRTLLVGGLDVPPLPSALGIEVVESVVVDAAVLDGVRRLRSQGHLIAVDDFTGTADQLAVLPHADLVKVDMRDLLRVGTDLLRRARAHGAMTVIERVETSEALDRCRALGFDLVQGNLLEPAMVLDISPAQLPGARVSPTRR